MYFEYKIKNFGKLSNENVQIKPLTVIVGKNNSGKSSITRSLYSILSSLHANHLLDAIGEALNGIEIELDALIRKISIYSRYAQYDEVFEEQMQILIRRFRDSLDVCDKKRLLVKNDFAIFETDSLKEMQENINIYSKKISRNADKESRVIEHIDNIINFYEILQKANTDKSKIFVKNMQTSLKNSFLKNFQVTSLKHLIGKSIESKRTEFDISNIGKIGITENQKEIEFSLNLNGMQSIQDLNNVIYLDSPIYPRLQSALTKKMPRSYFNKEEYLKEYPQYVDDLYYYLSLKYTGDASFQNISDEIENKIDGSLALRDGRYVYKQQSSETEYPLSMTAMGAVNIGILDMLIKNNVIKPGSFLIIDEPESYLHTEWQIVMAKILVELAKGGVFVVFATHSTEIIKFLEVSLQEDEANSQSEKKLSEIMSVHLMKTSGEVSNDSPLVDKIEEALYELTEPFSNLYFSKKGL